MNDDRRSAPKSSLADAVGPDPAVHPLDRLTWHYEHRREAALATHSSGIGVVGVTSATVPWELISAAGFFPVLLSPQRRPTPAGDRFMEDVFSERMRRIFDEAVRGEWQFLKLLVIPRTSEEEHKLFLYLREVKRQGDVDALPNIHLFDLLHAQSPQSHAYGLDRMRQLQVTLEELSGRSIATDALAAAIALSNAARAAIRMLLQLREGPAPRLSGLQAMSAIGAFYFMDRGEFAAIATDAVQRLADGPTLNGPRILVKGAPLDHLGLHSAIESQGAVVVAEDDWWGTRSAGRDVATDDDLICCLFEKYYLDVPSPRVFPLDVADHWFMQSLHGVDGVVFYLPPEDNVMGWDYPRQQRILSDRNIASLVVRADAGRGNIGPEWTERIETFVDALSTK